MGLFDKAKAVKRYVTEDPAVVGAERRAEKEAKQANGEKPKRRKIGDRLLDNRPKSGAVILPLFAITSRLVDPLSAPDPEPIVAEAAADGLEALNHYYLPEDLGELAVPNALAELEAILAEQPEAMAGSVVVDVPTP